MWPRRRSSFIALVLTAGVVLVATGFYLRLYKKDLSGQEHELVSSQQQITQKDVDSVTGFVFFIGSPRSGHSIIGSMLDAHPDAVVAHEYNLFKKMASDPQLAHNRTRLYGALVKNTRAQAATGWRSRDPSFAKKGYDLNLGKEAAWQGRFRTLQLIGDKSGGKTVRLFSEDKQLFSRLYYNLLESVNVPIKVIHVVRNPYDMIATGLMYRLSVIHGHKANYSSFHPLDNQKHISQLSKVMYEESQAVSTMIETLKLTVLEVHYMEFINDTEKVIQELCVFLGLQCSQEYLDMCLQTTFKTVSITRHSLVWSPAAQHFIRTNLLPFSFFSRYSFQSAY